MAISKIKTGSLTDNAVSTDKIASASVTKIKVSDDIITGQSELSEAANDADFTLIYDASSQTLKKILKSYLSPVSPTFSSVSPTNILATTGTTTTLVITGTGFTSGSTARLIGNTGHVVEFTTVTRDSTTQITAVATHSDLLYSNSPYGIQITNGTGIGITSLSQVDINASPTWVTSSGSLGTIVNGARTGVSLTFQAYDPDSTSQVDYEIISGSLSPGLSLSNDGTDVGTISGNATAVGSDTTSNFTIRAYDSASNFTDRAFSIQIMAPAYTSFTSSGTFSVPAGVSAVTVLVVAGAGGGGGGGGRAGPPGDNGTGGGGGGAGGLVFRPGFPVTPGGTVSVTIGCGGGAATVGQDSVFGTLTAKGGGGGGSGPGGQGGNGGSGGGTAGASGGGGPASTAIQPTQPGDSGTYGFGNAGGAATGGDWQSGGAGGGGAGAAGQTASGFAGTVGGVGRTYTIADGTTPVYYAGGGGGGGGHTGGGGGTPAAGGQGGGGAGGAAIGGSGTAGQANKGGAGGGGSQSPGGTPGTSGGKGIVIVEY